MPSAALLLVVAGAEMHRVVLDRAGFRGLFCSCFITLLMVVLGFFSSA
jgi:hypothetical protein